MLHIRQCGWETISVRHSSFVTYFQAILACVRLNLHILYVACPWKWRNSVYKQTKNSPQLYLCLFHIYVCMSFVCPTTCLQKNSIGVLFPNKYGDLTNTNYSYGPINNRVLENYPIQKSSKFPSKMTIHHNKQPLISSIRSNYKGVTPLGIQGSIVLSYNRVVLHLNGAFIRSLCPRDFRSDHFALNINDFFHLWSMHGGRV